MAVFAIYVLADLMASDVERPFRQRWRFWFLLVALPMLTLVHEGLFFFFPFFLAYEALKRGLRRDEMLMFGIPLSVAAVVFLASAIYRGDSGISAAMCSSLRSMSVDPELCGGAIAALERYDVSIGGQDLTRFLMLGALTFGPLLWYATEVLDSTRHPRTQLAIVLAMGSTLPLYVLSEDWGRWMHIAAMLILMIVIACKDVSIHLPRKHPALAIASFVAACTYVFAWQLPHWIHSSLPILRAAM